MDDLKIFIGGQWRHGGGNPMQSYFPADGSINATLNAASPDDLHDAIEAGERAWRDPAWRNSLPHMRAKILHKVADLIESRADELAQMQSRDNGKPLTEARGLVMSAAGTSRYFAAACELLEGELPTPRQPDLLTLSRYEPLGVVAAITPWNSPIASEMQKVAPAIAAGNAVILKPAEATPLMALELARIFEQAGLPAGLLSVLPGKGSVIGDALARHPRVRKISFTGGTTTGRHLAHVAAEKLIPASLELGGKSPTIVLEDADIEQAARGICYGIFSSAGQACIAGSRLFIHESLYAPLMARLLELTRGLRVGHPFTDGVHVGPLINEKHRQSVQAYVELAKREGGRVLCGGEIPADPTLASGSFFLPTIIEGLSNSARVCQEEIFGPVLGIVRAADYDSALELVNSHEFGNGSAVFTSNGHTAREFVHDVQAGMVGVNVPVPVPMAFHSFGGWKRSVFGALNVHGPDGVRFYTRMKTATVRWPAGQQTVSEFSMPTLG